MVALAAILLVAFFAHRPAFSSGYYFDDEHTLSGLGKVTDLDSALDYIRSGDTGPAGRPLSLASFVVNAASWPDAPEDFHYINTLVHLINGLLLFWLAWLVGRQLPKPADRPEWLALVACGLWLCHPLWISTVHLPVQRMTELATTFSLLGLVGYLKARAYLTKWPKAALAGMSASLLLSGALAVLSKENGILLPVYVLALELVLARPVLSGFDPVWRYWKVLALYLPILLIVAYMSKLVLLNPISVYAGRDFSLSERLLTEGRVLWSYIQLLVFPRTSSITIFGDDYPISTGWNEPATTFLAALAWSAVIAAAAIWRRKYPLFAAAVLWFLGGHLLESTIVPLELYFEHRNYLPAVGPVLFLAVWLEATRHKRTINMAYVVGLYWALFVFVLYQTAHTWSNPFLTAKWAYDTHPLSARAAQFYSKMLYRAGEKPESVKVIQDAHQRIPKDTALALQALGLGCGKLDTAQIDSIVLSIDHTLKYGSRTTASLDAIHQMIQGLDSADCPNLKPSHIHSMLDSLLANKNYQASGVYLSKLHEWKARLYLRDRNFNSTMLHYEKAFELDPRLDLALLIPPLFLSAGLPDLALQRIDLYLGMQANNGTTQEKWHRELNTMRSMIENALTAQAAYRKRQPTQP